MFRSLHAKLTFSHVILAVLILVIAIVLVAGIVTGATRTLNLEQVRVRLLAVASRLQRIEALAARPQAFRTRLATEADRIGARLLLVDGQMTVVFDSEEALEGETISLDTPEQRWPNLPANVRRVRTESRLPHFAVYTRLTSGEAATPYYLAVVVPTATVNPSWSELLRPLLLVAGALLLIAIAIGYSIARSITHPLVEITQAAEAMAAGSYGQRVDVAGRDEVARLARSFTRMSGQVARSRQAQRDLLANVSHDLKTPLTSIQGFSQAILEGAVTDEAGYHRAAEIIQNEAGGMLILVQDLLDLARVETGELDLSGGAISVGDMVVGLVAQAQPRAQQRQTRIEIDQGQGIPLVLADPGRLSQAISNLLDNAIKHAAGEWPIQVRLAHLPTDAARPTPLPVHLGPDWGTHAWVSLSVSNPCPPIPPQELERIFERFYQGDRSRGSGEGSGLGLAIVRETVAAHGGIVEARSEADGTEFRIWLPADTSSSSTLA